MAQEYLSATRNLEKRITNHLNTVKTHLKNHTDALGNINGGGGGSATSTVEKQQEQIDLLTDVNNKITSCNTNGLSTSTNQQISQNLFKAEFDKKGNTQVYLNSASGTAIKADSTCTIQEDIDYKNGWYIINDTAGTKFNIYVGNGAEEKFTLADINSVYFKAHLNRYTGVASVPFMQIYTKPTGVNDAGAFFHSRINYVFNQNEIIGIGEEIVFFGGQAPSKKFSQRSIELTDAQILGENNTTEEILFIVCASSSNAGVNELNVNLTDIGFEYGNITRNYELLGKNTLTQLDNLNNKIIKTEGQSYTTNSGGLIANLIYGKNLTGNGNLEAIQVDSVGRVITSPAHNGMITTDGTGTEQRVMCNGNYNGNLRTFRVSADGSLLVESEHSWTTSTILNTIITAGSTSTSSIVDLGQGKSHEIDNVIIFVYNSLGQLIEVKSETSYDGINWFEDMYNMNVTTSNKNFNGGQEKFGVTRGHRYFRFQVTNLSQNNTDVNIHIGYYK